MQAKVKGRVALIAGASDEVGAEVARRLAREGAIVVLCDGNSRALDALVKEISAAGGVASALVVDVSEPAAISSGIERTVASHGKIDILINNGIDPKSRSFGDLTVQDFAATLQSSLGSQFCFLKAVIPVLLKTIGVRVINISTLP